MLQLSFWSPNWRSPGGNKKPALLLSSEGQNINIKCQFFVATIQVKPTSKCSLYTTNTSLATACCASTLRHTDMFDTIMAAALLLFFPAHTQVFSSTAKCQHSSCCEWGSLCACVCVQNDSLSLCPKQRDSCETRVPLPIIQHCLMRSLDYRAGMTLHICQI